MRPFSRTGVGGTLPTAGANTNVPQFYEAAESAEGTMPGRIAAIAGW